MRAATFFASLFIAGVLSSPVYETKNVYVYETIVITEQSVATPAPEPLDNSPAEQPRVYTWPFGRHHRFRHSWFYNSPPVATPVNEELPPPPPPSSTPPPPPPPPPSSTPPPPPPPASTPQPEPEPEPKPTPEPAAKPEPKQEASGDESPLSGGVSLLSTCNKWRSIYNLPKFAWDKQLEKNALKTGVDGGGVNQVHQLGPGSYGQVITPGMKHAVGNLGGDTPFELSYVAWLCEKSSDPQLKTGGDQCGLVDKNLHMYYTSTGHYDILTNDAYKTIGCAFAENPNAASDSPWQGLWVCDLGFGK